MSSMLRTMQKRILKRAGYHRERERLAIIGGAPVLVRLRKGEGDIVKRSGESVGRLWPLTIPDLGGATLRRVNARSAH